MIHWLEEAENKISHKNSKKTAIKDRIEHKKDEVKENRILLEEDYLEIIDQFNSLVDRVNSLPRQSRIPFGQIHSKHKENKLDNLLYKFYSSRRIASREFRSLLRPFKTQQYKNTRTFFISIGRKKNHILIEYKEVRAKRLRINDERISIWRKLWGSNKQKSNNTSRVIDDVKNLHLDLFNDAFIMDHIDWLAFRKEEISFN